MLELDAAFEESTLRIQVQNHSDDCTNAASVAVRAPAWITLISAVPYVRPTERRNELDIVLPAPLRGERYDLAVDVHAFETGEAEIAVSIECDGARRDVRARCTMHGAEAFATGANRIELFENEAAAGDVVHGRLILTNTGNGPANVVALHAEGDLADVVFDVQCPLTIDPGMRITSGVRARVPESALNGTPQSLRVICGTASGNVEIGEAQVFARNQPRLEGAIEPQGYADVAVAPGERADWRLRLVNAGGAHADFTIALHVAGGVYLPGSTRIEGARALDVAGTSPLWSRDGMRIERLQRGTVLTLEFATIGNMGAGAMNVLARAQCEGRESLFESPAIKIADCSDAPELPFTIDGVALRIIAMPSLTAPPSVISRRLRSGAATLEAPMASYLAGLSGLMRHLWALAILCADSCEDPATESHLIVSRIALRSVFDRLAIKLRMPHYPVRADDVLDPAAQDALDASGIAAGTLGTRLACAAQLIASERDEYLEFAAYRDALCATLQGLHDDAALIDALVAAQPALDARLDAVIERETGVHA